MEKGKKCTSPFHGIHVICYIKYKLLYKFRIVAFFFFFFPNISIVFILLKLEL